MAKPIRLLIELNEEQAESYEDMVKDINISRLLNGKPKVTNQELAQGAIEAAILDFEVSRGQAEA